MVSRELISEYVVPLYPLPTAVTPRGKLPVKVQCVLFDIYGTLFISQSGDISIAQENSSQLKKIDNLLLKFDISRTSQDLIEDLFLVIRNEHERLRKKGIDYPEIKIEQIWMKILKTDDLRFARHFATEYELIANPVYPMPNLKETLSACKKKQKLMGIISNAQFYTPYLFEWFLNSSLERLGFHPELIFLSYRIQHAKPSQLPFQKAVDALNTMGIDRRFVLYIGNDMRNDIYPAKKLGFKTALFAGDARSLRLRSDDPCCNNLSADLVLTDLSQLIDHL
jgi:putative hydrolase of the HAD superfamily